MRLALCVFFVCALQPFYEVPGDIGARRLFGALWLLALILTAAQDVREMLRKGNP